MFEKLDKLTSEIRKLRKEYDDEIDKIISENFSPLFELISEIGFVKTEFDYNHYLTVNNNIYSFKFDFEDGNQDFFIAWEDLKHHDNWFIIKKNDNIKESLEKLMNDIREEYINFKPYLRRLKFKKFTDNDKN